MKKLYHKDLGIPNVVMDQVRALGTLLLCYTKHAMLECVRDRYGVINPPALCSVARGMVIEVETWNGIVVKVVIRQSYDDSRDLCMALGVAPRHNKATVYTVWTNLVNDRHSTVDLFKYDQP